ncbi:MAG: response regulator, partial [Draconibacterium sp.]|nr:response regulator [Draconibacterium sp.]
MKKIRILIVDDHQLIINGIKVMIESIEEFHIIGEANDGKEA